MNNLTKMCISHIKKISIDYISESDLRCRNCDGLNQRCNYYNPYNPSIQIPVRKGKLNYELTK